MGKVTGKDMVKVTVKDMANITAVTKIMTMTKAPGQIPMPRSTSAVFNRFWLWTVTYCTV